MVRAGSFGLNWIILRCARLLIHGIFLDGAHVLTFRVQHMASDIEMERRIFTGCLIGGLNV